MSKMNTNAKHIKYFISLAIMLMMAASCNKWLSVKPQNGLIRADFWKTKEQLQAAVIGCYSSLLDPSLVSDLFVWGELRADMVASTLNTPVDAVNIMNDNIVPTNAYTDWSAVYRTINYCNTVIEFGPQVLPSDKTLTETQLDAYLAEAHGLRALMYFYLLRTFGEVPLQLNATASDNQIELIPKSSQQAVYNQIISDLKYAQQHAVTTYGSLAMDKGRITKYTVFAIEADAYLWENKYDSCTVACDSIIDSHRFGLIDGTDQAQWFHTLYYEGNSSESIFEFQYSAQKLNPFYNMFISSNNQYIAAEGVMQDVFGIDPTGLNADIRGNGGSLNASDGTIWKYAGATSGAANDVNATMTTRTADQSYAHWFVYRYPDILLMKAEALAWMGEGQQALDLVNTVRERAHALDITAETPDTSDAEGITEYILSERSREFAYEGKRWFDVLRVAKRNNYEDLSLLLQIVSENVPGNLKQTVINKYKDVRSHYLPVNATELQADPKLVQNPFYQ